LVTSGQSAQLALSKHGPGSSEVPWTTSPAFPLKLTMVFTRKTFMWCVPMVWAITKRLTAIGTS
jgi:hypothetical protein